MTYELKDWLNSINIDKEGSFDDDPSAKYPAIIVNRCMSGHLDTVLFANEMNMKPNLDLKMQYSFLLNSVRKRKRFSHMIKSAKMKSEIWI